MATSGRGSGVVGYNVQAAVGIRHHLIVTHKVNTGHTDKLDVIADRGYYNSDEILACDEADIEVTSPKPMTSENRSKGRFVKADFRYVKILLI